MNTNPGRQKSRPKAYKEREKTMKRMLYDKNNNFTIEQPEEGKIYTLGGRKFSSDSIMIINGKPRPWYMSLSPRVSDSECCRVKIGGKWYYFG